MDPVKALEEISLGMEGKTRPKQSPVYRTIRVRSEVFSELEQWREMWSDQSLSGTLSRILALARRELKNVALREEKVRREVNPPPPVL